LNGVLTRYHGQNQLKSIQIELTRTCNLRCPYCHSESGPWHKKSGISLESLRELLTQAADLGCMTVDFTGGEPLVHRHWYEVLSFARQLGLVVTLHSNGTLLSEAVLQRLSSLPLRHLQVSLDSHLPDVHDACRGMPGAWAKSIQAIRRAKELGMRVRVAIVAHSKNRDHFREAVTYFESELGVSVNMDRVVNVGGERTAHWGLTTSEYYELIAPLLRGRAVSTRVCETAVQDLNMSRIEPNCGVAHSLLYVTADGEIALCPTMTSRNNPEFKSPLLTDMDLRTAWEESDYFIGHRFLNCRNVNICPSGRSCGGGCRSNAYRETGEIDSPDPLHCNVNKNPSETFVDFLAEYKRQGSEVAPRALVRIGERLRMGSTDM
jgi:radical SAM protein with 4Fe4S-binding SPASM domain